MLNLPIIKCIATSGISIDILFIISGFLISFLLMKEHKEYGKVNLAGFFCPSLRPDLPSVFVDSNY